MSDEWIINKKNIIAQEQRRSYYVQVFVLLCAVFFPNIEKQKNEVCYLLLLCGLL